MGTDDRPPSGPLIQRLIRQPQGFDLFQAISLLERAAPGAGAIGNGEGRREAVRLKAQVTLGFPSSDVVQVEENGDDAREPFTLTTPVMALTGASGPLPLVFTEQLLERRAARDHATADFLDIFQHRFLSFLYGSRKKHRIGLDWRSPNASALAGVLDAVSALNIKRAGGEGAWLRHAGLLGGAPRSMSGLLQFLRDRLRLEVRGTQLCGGWHTLEAQAVPRLGASGSAAPRLGRNAVLGRRVWDQGAGISLAFGKLPWNRLESLLPGGADHQLAGRLVRRYLQQEIDVHMTVQPAPGQAQNSVLGGPRSLRLGWTAWLRTGGASRPMSASFKLAGPAAGPSL
jgi:type VI secretion system protein ImpH